MTAVVRKTVSAPRLFGSRIAPLPNGTADTVADRFRPGAGIYVSRTGAVLDGFSSEFSKDGHQTATSSGRLTTATDRRELHPADAGVTTRELSGLADLVAVGGPKNVDELTERGAGDRGRCLTLTDPASRSVNSLGTPAACEAEAMLSHREKDHSCRNHRGGVSGRPHVVPGGRTVGNSVRRCARSLVGQIVDAEGLV